MLKLKLQYFGHLMWRADSLEKTQMMGKIEGGRRRGRQDEMVGWYHWLDGHEFEQTLRVGDGQGSLVCCSPWSRKELDTIEWLNWLYVFLQKCLFRSSSHFSIGLFIFLISSYMSYLCILEINPLSFASIENIFSYSEGCLFILFMVVFAVQKLLRLIRSHLLTFVFIFIILGGGSKKILLWFKSISIVPMFSSESFIVSGLTLRCFIHF